MSVRITVDGQFCVEGFNPCDDGDDCTDDLCDEETDTCGEHICNASGVDDPCCLNPACSSESVCSNGGDTDGDGILDDDDNCRLVPNPGQELGDRIPFSIPPPSVFSPILESVTAESGQALELRWRPENYYSFEYIGA